MYYYKIGYYTCEENDYWVLSHEKKFTKNELEKLIFEKTDKAIKIAKKQKIYLHNFQDIAHIVVKLLVDEEGFKYLDYEIVYDFFGWASLFVNDWQSYVDENLKKLREYLKKKGYSEKDDEYYNSEFFK